MPSSGFLFLGRHWPLGSRAGPNFLLLGTTDRASGESGGGFWEQAGLDGIKYEGPLYLHPSMPEPLLAISHPARDPTALSLYGKSWLALSTSSLYP